MISAVPGCHGRHTIALLLALAALVSCADTEDVAQQTFRPANAGRLTVATTLPAPGYWEGADVDHLDGGFEWAIAEELAERFDLPLEIVDVPFERIVAGELGEADLALAQVSITNERGEVLDFSVPYATIDAGVLVRAGEEITDLHSAREERWAVVGGSTDEEFLADVVRPDADPLVVADEVAAADAITAGVVDAALMDLPTALVIARDRDDVTATARFATAEEIGAALPEGSPNVEVVDAALRAMEAEGRFAELATDWLEPAFGVHPNSLPVIRAR